MGFCYGIIIIIIIVIAIIVMIIVIIIVIINAFLLTCPLAHRYLYIDSKYRNSTLSAAWF